MYQKIQVSFSVDKPDKLASITGINVWLECESYCWSLIGTNNLYRAVSNDADLYEDLVVEKLSPDTYMVQLTQTPMSQRRLTQKTAEDGKFVLHYVLTGPKGGP